MSDIENSFAWRLKRLIDIIGAILSIIILSPLLLFIALAIVLDSGWSPLFVQQRIGKHGQTFRVIKFRTMVNNAEKLGAGLYFEENDPRITRVGHFLRRYSLDELPQLINVLLGDESLIGPRAMVPSIANKLDDTQNQRHRIKPGITGWAQVNGRNRLTWSQRIELDNWYIENMNLWLDIKICILTLKVLMKTEDVLMNQVQADVDDLESK